MDETIIKEGLALLKNQKHYNQAIIVRKLNFLGKIVSEPTISNILNGKKVKSETLAMVSLGIQEILMNELGLCWGKSKFIKNEEPGWKPTIVGELKTNDPALVLKPGFAFYENGRLSIGQKVGFFSTAQKEVIEFGITLNTFTSYFINRGDWEFKSHVENLLSNSVNFKCYLLDPDCNEARLYFEDRKRIQGELSKGTETIKESIYQLNKVKETFKKAGHPGDFKIYTYKHIPYNYFMAVDGDTVNGKMMVSHYIYGESRANCPVVEFSKTENRLLFKKYWASLQSLIKNAKETT